MMMTEPWCISVTPDIAGAVKGCTVNLWIALIYLKGRCWTGILAMIG